MMLCAEFRGCIVPDNSFRSLSSPPEAKGLGKLPIMITSISSESLPSK
jgi:hypothetical protein